MGALLGTACACCKNGWYKDNRKITEKQATRRDKKKGDLDEGRWLMLIWT